VPFLGVYIEAVDRTLVSMPREQNLPQKPSLKNPDHIQKFGGAKLAEVFRTSLYDCSIESVCRVSRIILLLLILLNSIAALAADPGLRMSQYAHTSWRLQDGVFNGIPTAIVQTADGIWVVTSGGLDRFRVPKVLTFSSREGLSSDHAGSVVAATDGTVWVGNHDALDEIQDRTVSSVRAKQGLPGRRVTVLLEDHLRRLWVGVDNTLSVREGRRFHTLSRSDGSPVGTLQKLIEDRNGDLWGIPAPNTSRLIHIHGFLVQEESIGPESSRITSIAADPNSGIRVGFRNGDIAIYTNGTLNRIMTGSNRPVYHPKRIPASWIDDKTAHSLASNCS
jgi:ligand-binding sensor domain-containing protein